MGNDGDKIEYVSDSLPFQFQGSEDKDFSETAKFISHILMEENVEQSPFYDSLSLQLTEKSFYDALAPDLPLYAESQTSNSTSTSTTSSSNDEIPRELKTHALQPDLNSSIAQLLAHNIFHDVDSVSQFRRGLEEASRFLPPGPNLGESSKGRKYEERRRQERYSREEEGERRSNKQSALGLVDESDLSDAFDRVLLNEGNLCQLQSEGEGVEEYADGIRGRTRKQGRSVDLRNLLHLCAQSVYSNDNRTAIELLIQIRHHSSSTGDASQRLSHYFANALHSRLFGNSTPTQGTYSYLTSTNVTVADFLKAYQVFLSSTPFKKFNYFFANKMILKAASNAQTLHVIDFGILYGFQWPILIKFLSNREGGPPKLRITGIEFPQPGFRPAQKIQETGHRLANYCKRYNVPFQYNAIASRNWETIQIQTLQIQSNEVVAVNCHLRFENLLDESIEVTSPRNTVLHLIRKINPHIFTHCITNGSYNSPFFATRFREALFHYSSAYDMCDTVIPRENEWRLMIERELLGREIMNVIACEGSERIERPETYKQWQVRNTRAGFKQLPLNEELVSKFRTKLEGPHFECFHLLGASIIRCYWIRFRTHPRLSRFWYSWYGAYCLNLQEL
ncbi:hypothetical protein VNO78_05516 [Psophocarpus tetragonolobus]|uniref:Scarecrow-like protein 14 n=1 Tax=Psophocarpus tetragonolobus TaxID=3891 RepID=A0AAN9STS1_PSOTE